MPNVKSKNTDNRAKLLFEHEIHTIFTVYHILIYISTTFRHIAQNLLVVFVQYVISHNKSATIRKIYLTNRLQTAILAYMTVHEHNKFIRGDDL